MRRRFSILRDGHPVEFIAIIDATDTGHCATVESLDGRPMRGIVAVGDDERHTLKQLQGALIFHLDGCAEEGIDPWENDPELEI